VASFFKVRCILSCFPFCWGLPRSICSGYMPSLIHQTERVDNRARAFEAKGTPVDKYFVFFYDGRTCVIVPVFPSNHRGEL
jgi:hypothetical protein